MNVSSLLLSIRWSLTAGGVPSPEVDAEILIGHVLGLKRSALYLNGGREVAPVEESAIMELAVRRRRRVPLQYLVGECEFMSLTFRVKEGVFIPRPETEVLVDALRDRVGDRAHSVRILDICTGCGAIAVALAKYLRPCLVLGSDISPAAVEIAHQNAILNGVEGIAGFVAADGLDFMRCGEHPVRGRFDVVACNPPYVESGAIDGLEPEVRNHDPRPAIDGGADGLDFIERILPEISSILTRNGLMGLEIGPSQGPEVLALMKTRGLRETEVLKDLNGLDRVVLGRSA